MSVTLEELRTELQQRLGDSSEAIWQASELEGYIQEGYDQLTKVTGCLLGVALAPDYAFAFSYTQDWELGYITEDYANGPAQFTSEFERDYVNNAQGPANHSHHWEFNLGYVTDAGIATEVSGLVDLPEDLHEIERATWNTRRIDALRSRELEGGDSRYELNKGEVQAYTQDKDGIHRFRKWRVPSTAYVPYEFDEDSDDGFGILRDITDIVDTDVISYGFGDLIQVDGVNVFEDYGILGPVYKETSNVRMEYRRRGLPLSVDQDFEIPDRYTVYVRHYAQARALDREGPGQELELAAHFQSRYEAGVARMLKRKQAMHYQRKYILGGSTNSNRSRLPLARLPWNYGTVVR